VQKSYYRCNFTKFYYTMTLTNSYNTLFLTKHGILGPEYTEKLTASEELRSPDPPPGLCLWTPLGGLPSPRPPALPPSNVRHKLPPLQWTNNTSTTPESNRHTVGRLTTQIQSHTTQRRSQAHNSTQSPSHVQHVAKRATRANTVTLNKVYKTPSEVK